MSPTRQQYRQGARDGTLAAMAYDAESERQQARLEASKIEGFNALARIASRRGIDTSRADCLYDLHVLLGIRRDDARRAHLLGLA